MYRTLNYPSEFKEEAVKLVLSSDKPTSQIAVELDIKPNTLYNWKDKAMKSKTPPSKPKKSTNGLLTSRIYQLTKDGYIHVCLSTFTQGL